MHAFIVIIQQYWAAITGSIAPPPVLPPAVPANLRLRGVHQEHLNQVEIEWGWDPVTYFGGAGATSITYQSQHRAVGAAWPSATHDNRTATTRTIAVVEDADTQYEFRVRAVNNLGAESAWATSSPVAATAGAPVHEGRDMQWSGRDQEWATRAQIWGQ